MKCLYKIIFTLSLSFVLVFQQQVHAQNIADLPDPGEMVVISSKYRPTKISGISIDPKNPLKLHFILDVGDDNLKGEDLKKESKRLINYFFTALTVPEDDLWVNLSPYEKDRVVAKNLGVTEMGRDMLAQDYMLKQFTASLMYPENEIGERFWEKVHTNSQIRFGDNDIPTNAFNKVWIVPKKAVIYIDGTNIFVSESHLQVMLEEDYLSLDNDANRNKHGLDKISKDEVAIFKKETRDMIKGVILPEIEREINEGKNFANLRQIYNSLILATWYKKNLKDSILGQVYTDKNIVTGVDLEDKLIAGKIYNQYTEAFKKGVYDYSKEEYNPVTQKIITRKYFSGGVLGKVETKNGNPSLDLLERYEDMLIITVGVGFYDALKETIIASALTPEETSELLSSFSTIKLIDSMKKEATSDTSVSERDTPNDISEKMSNLANANRIDSTIDITNLGVDYVVVKNEDTSVRVFASEQDAAQNIAEKVKDSMTSQAWSKVQNIIVSAVADTMDGPLFTVDGKSIVVPRKIILDESFNSPRVIRPLTDNSINSEQAQSWIDAQKTEENQDLARFIVNSLNNNYVSQEDFETALQRSVNRFNQSMDRPYTLLNVTTSEKGMKSNAWVYQLALEKGLRPPAQIVDISDKKQLDEINLVTSDVVIIDDATYSGFQVADFFSKGKVGKALQSGTVKAHAIVPFLTKKAMETIAYDGYDIEVYDSRTMNLIAYLLFRAGYRLEENLEKQLNKFYDLYQGKFQRTLTYFQHTIADALSFLSFKYEISGESVTFPVVQGPVFDESGNLVDIMPLAKLTPSVYKDEYIYWLLKQESKAPLDIDSLSETIKQEQSYGGIDFKIGSSDIEELGNEINFRFDNSLFQDFQPNSIYGISLDFSDITPIANFASPRN